MLDQLDQKQPENRDVCLISRVTNLITKSKRFETGPLDLWPQQQRQQQQHQHKHKHHQQKLHQINRPRISKCPTENV